MEALEEEEEMEALRSDHYVKDRCRGKGGDIGKRKLQAAYSSKTLSTKLLFHYLEKVFGAIHTDHILQQWPLQHVRQHRFAYGTVCVNVNMSFSQFLCQKASFHDIS